MTITTTPETATPDIARPYWMRDPCPAWCTSRHEKHENREDRVHSGETEIFDLTLMRRASRHAADAEDLTAHLDAGIWQAWRDARPYIYLSLNDGQEIHFELAEAQEAARLLAAPPGEWAQVVLTMMEPEPVMGDDPGLPWIRSFPFAHPPVLAVRAMPGTVLVFSSFLSGCCTPSGDGGDQAPGYLALTPGEASEIAAAINKLLDGAR